MRRITISLTVMAVIMLIFLTACSSGKGSGTAPAEDPAAKQGSEQQEPATKPQRELTVQRNEEDDLVIAVTFQDLLQAWNEEGNALKLPDTILPGAEDMESYVTSSAIHSGHRTRHYVYAPGDEHFYPILHFYVSEKSGELLEIDLSYNEHDYRDSTRKTYEEMCLVALSILVPDLATEDLTELRDKVYDNGVDYIYPSDKDYGEGAVPAVLYQHNGIGVYPYFAVGSRSHFCLVPVDRSFLKELQSGGTEVNEMQ